MKDFHSKLSEHKIKKGKVITPFNYHLGSMLTSSSWSHDRLPEYLWLGLILDNYGREQGIEKGLQILNYFAYNFNNIEFPQLSKIFTLDEAEQASLYSYISNIVEPKILSPLTLLYRYSQNTTFVKHFNIDNVSIEDRLARLNSTLQKFYPHQSHDATDLKFLVIMLGILKRQVVIPQNELTIYNDIINYPQISHEDESMRAIRPSVRSFEGAVHAMSSPNIDFINSFWEDIGKMSECNLFYINFKGREEENTGEFASKVRDIIENLALLNNAQNPVNQKATVLIGIFTYSYKILAEVSEFKLFNSILGRSAIRTIIENYIMMKYLLQKEQDHANIWSDFQYYGIGKYKMIMLKSREINRGLDKHHVDYNYLDVLVNEYIMEEYIDIDLRYFDNQNIREKAAEVNEKELYDLFYDYDSSYGHGLWGAVRESSLLKCNCSAHQYHCVPDYDRKQNLISIWYDCKYVICKTIQFLSSVFDIPENLLKAVIEDVE